MADTKRPALRRRRAATRPSRENLRGGIRYFAELLGLYDQDPRLALIAYDAGPQHANRVRAGTVVAYRETRKYLDAIAAHYPLR